MLTTHLKLISHVAETPAIRIQHVPYRGAGPALTDLMSGQVPIAFLGFGGQVLGLHQLGKIRLLAITSREQSKAALDIPTAAESGFPEMIVQTFVGLLAPARTPAHVMGQIAQASRKAMAEPDLQQLFYKAGMEPVLDSGPDQMAQFIEQEIARWTPVIRSMGLKLD